MCKTKSLLTTIFQCGLLGIINLSLNFGLVNPVYAATATRPGLSAAVKKRLANMAQLAGAENRDPLDQVARLAKQVYKFEQQWDSAYISEDQFIVWMLRQWAASGESGNQQLAMGYEYILGQRQYSAPSRYHAAVELMSSSDQLLKSRAKELLHGLTVSHNSFSFFQTILQEARKKNKNPPWVAIRYMYQNDPDRALLTVLDAYFKRPVSAAVAKRALWAQHMVSNTLWKEKYGFVRKGHVEPKVMKQLSLMSNHPKWWARLYAAAIMKQHPEFRQANVVKRLKMDTNPLVREMVKSFVGGHKNQKNMLITPP